MLRIATGVPAPQERGIECRLAFLSRALPRKRRGRSAFVNQVSQCQPGMAVGHTRAGKAHDLPHSLAHALAVAMDRTFVADRFVLMKRAVVQAAVRVIQELPAIRAKYRLRVVMCAAVDAHHGCDGLILPGDAWMALRHSFLPIQRLAFMISGRCRFALDECLGHRVPASTSTTSLTG